MTACCQSYNTVTFPDGGFLRVPSSQIVDTNCTLPDFGNLVVEVNGVIAALGEAGCSGGGSFSVPNSSACHISGTTGGPGGSIAGSCVWSDRYALDASGGADCVTSGSSYPWMQHIVVVATPGVLAATYGIQRGSACNTNGGFGSPDYFLVARFQLNYDGSSVPDLSGPVSLPCTAASSAWDSAEPLVIHF